MIDNEKTKWDYKQSVIAKIVAMALLVVFVGAFILSAIGAYLTTNDYGLNISDINENYIGDIALSEGYWLMDEYYNFGKDEDMLEEKVKRSFAITNITGFQIIKNDKVMKEYFSEEYTNSNISFSDNYYEYTENEEGKPVEYKVYIDENYPVVDIFWLTSRGLGVLMALDYWIFGIMLLSFVVAAFCFVFLIVSAGHKKNYDDIYENYFVRIPWDLYSIVMITIISLLSVFTASIFYQVSYANALFFLVSGVGVLVVVGILAMIYIMDFAVRVKKKSLFKNTIIYIFFSKTSCKIGQFIGKLPLIKKTAVFLIVLNVLFLLLGFVPGGFIVDLVLVPVSVYFAFNLQELKNSAKNLAEGNLDYKINTEKMYWDIKETAENLNSISEGMHKAVEERMKSEYFKTELITNVSHDLKTPLTSVINYADLIGKENTDNENIKEYTEILLKHSNRLKRLVEDLVEASKASTGNLDINLEPFKIGVFASQTIGEYEEKFQAANLELIVKDIDENLKIMADGRRIWRVFDNLMNNICKYSVPGSRVYLDVESVDSKIRITFKNISKDPLNIKPQELMERFVRGDESRNTEGNGLGLSIAKSMTELQGGKMEIFIDGDLFKVVLVFNELV